MASSNSSTVKVVYVYSKDLVAECNKIVTLKGRASMVHSLIEALNLTEKMSVIPSQSAEEDELYGFHSRDYIEFLKKLDQSKTESDNEDENDEFNNEEEEEYGIGYDCPAIPNLEKFLLTVAGGSLTAARTLLQDNAKIAINWLGGWHHAQRDQAEGFCYVNDCVLAILELRKKYDRVLYIDLDIHHGDGVENAFLYSPKVFTFSVHKHEPGFFPGTGAIHDRGVGKGRNFCCNVPLKDGTSDKTFCFVFERIFKRIAEYFQPEAIVCQCGADGLVNDPLGSFNLTAAAYITCVRLVTSLNIPTLLLGGGGYNLPNAARSFAAITAAVLNENLPSSIPEHEYFDRYGPGFDVEITAGLRRDENDENYINHIISTTLENLQ